jgi:hypothetical protein
VNLKTALNMAKENGSRVKVPNVTLMKVTMLLIRNKVMEFLDGLQEIPTKENILRMKEKVMVKCSGLMVHSTKETG